MNEIIEHNRKKFDKIKKLHLPLGQYAITGSGPLGIRNLRSINDLDIIACQELWDKLAQEYGIIDADGVRKIVIPNEDIELFCENSFYLIKKEENEPTVEGRIASAKVIDDLAFESLMHVLYYKRKMGREKDLPDILLIEKALSKN